MWRTLPVKDPESLVLLTHSRGTAFRGGFTFQQYRIMRRQQNRGFTELAAWSSARLNVSVDGSPEPTTDGQLVSGNYFSLLGVSPIAGRAIAPEDDLVPNGHPVADDQLWLLEAAVRTVPGGHRPRHYDLWYSLHDHRRDSSGVLRCSGWHIAESVPAGDDAADRDAGLSRTCWISRSSTARGCRW